MSSDNPPWETTPPDAKQRLAPYREEIDRLDNEIIRLIGERFAVVRQVAVLKHRYGIHPVLTDRVEEVLERARQAADSAGFAPEIANQIYRLLITESCRIEAEEAVPDEPGHGAAPP
jgi:chorismate mutase